MNRIKELREDKDLRQLDVAKATGIDQRTLSNYETGKTNPDSFAIIKLAEFFEVTTDYLLGIDKTSENTIESLLIYIDKIKIELDKLTKDIKRL